MNLLDRYIGLAALRSILLVAFGLTALFRGVGYLIGGASGAMIALLFAAATNLFTYWNSDRMVLSAYGAHEVDARNAPESDIRQRPRKRGDRFSRNAAMPSW